MLVTVLTLLCAIALVFFFLLLPGESSQQQREPFWQQNIAHRGLYSKDQAVPENSLAAFTAAAEEGYGIELDIRLSRDGAVVVFHDDTLERCCKVQARVDETDLDELRTLTLFETSQHIPTLREALEIVDGKVPLVIELKHGGNHKALCENAWRILRRYDGDICVESFDPRIVRWFQKNVPGLLRGQLAAPPRALKQGPKGYAVGWLFTNFLGRPQFIAYQKGPKPLSVRLACRFAMRFAWTARPGDDNRLLQQENDAVIFEHYQPGPYFGGLPD